MVTGESTRISVSLRFPGREMAVLQRVACLQACRKTRVTRLAAVGRLPNIVCGAEIGGLKGSLLRPPTLFRRGVWLCCDVLAKGFFGSVVAGFDEERIGAGGSGGDVEIVESITVTVVDETAAAVFVSSAGAFTDADADIVFLSPRIFQASKPVLYQVSSSLHQHRRA